MRTKKEVSPDTANEPRSMPQDAEFAPAIATEIEDKPDSASTGKPARWTEDMVKSFAGSPRILANAINADIDKAFAATPSGGMTQNQIHSLANLLVADSTSLNFTQLQSYEAKVQRWESIISERLVIAPSGGGEKWTEGTVSNLWHPAGNPYKRIADAHNATLQPQDDKKRLDWLQSPTGKRWLMRGDLPTTIGANVRKNIDAAMRKEAK